MPTEPQVPTLAEIVRRAVEVADPAGLDPAVSQFAARFEDRDEPVTAIPDLDEELDAARELIDPAPTEPAVVMAAAVTAYLAHRRDELEDDRETLLRLAARAELGDDPDPSVADWLAGHGVEGFA